MLIHLIAAARPNFMKVAPVYHALKKESWANPVIVHTGQHYDLNMSDAFFTDLALPQPDINLGIGSCSHAQQVGQIMISYERELIENRPDLVIVVGDVNSTLAVTLSAVKLQIKVAHLEAGLRSFDRTMPEEINRLVTDTLADILWTPSPDADENLLREGICRDKIDRVGNIIIDSLEMLRERIEREHVYNEFNVVPKEFGVVTLHRPCNVDNPEILKEFCVTLIRIARKIQIVFPIHPRTRKNLLEQNIMPILEQEPGLIIVEPLNYIRFMNLVFNCRLAITDSGGIQEETTYLGVPCITLRPNTERPITLTLGTNRICKMKEMEPKVAEILGLEYRRPCSIELWDGKTAERVVRSIKSRLL